MQARKGTGISRKFSNAAFTGDVKPVSELADEAFTWFYAMVTPDGAWHQKGSMGWFGLFPERSGIL